MTFKLPNTFIPQDYELEFRIENIDVIKQILRNPRLKFKESSDSLVSSLQPVLKYKNNYYRSEHFFNSLNSDIYLLKEVIQYSVNEIDVELVDNFNSIIPDSMVNTFDKINKTVKTKMIMKYSRETRISNISHLEKINTFRKLRIRYYVEGLNFYIDLTARYFPIAETDIEEMNYVKFNLNNIINLNKDRNINHDINKNKNEIQKQNQNINKNMNITSARNDKNEIQKQNDLFEPIEGYKLIVDMEFEFNNNNSLSLIQEFNKLLCFITNYDHITFHNIQKNIKFNFTVSPQVGIITNNILKNVSTNKFVWSEKMDGERCLLIIYNNNVYTWKNVDKFRYLQEINDFKNIFIFDCEMIKNKNDINENKENDDENINEKDKDENNENENKDDKNINEYKENKENDENNIFYIFDSYIYDSKDIRNLDYITRLKYANRFIKILKTNNSNSNLNLKLLQINRIDNYSNLINYAFSKHTNTDGVVLHSLDRINISRWPKITIAYKLKPISLNTIDFLYKYIPSKKYYQLYLCGNHETFVHVMRDKSITDKISQELFNYDLSKPTSQNYFILFDSPYFENMWKYVPNVDDITNLGLKDLKELDSKIVESEFNTDLLKWKPVRIRYDKEFPNNYNVGLTNSSLLFDPPHHLSTNTNKTNKIIIDDKLLRLEEYTKTYIWDYLTINSDEYFPFSKEPIIMLDYNANSSDIINYYTSNVRKIFAVNDDKTELVNYVETIKNVYNNNSNFKHITNITNQIKHSRITLNIFTKDNFKEKILNSNDFNIHEINMIYVDTLNDNFEQNVEDEFKFKGEDILNYDDFYNLCNHDYIIIYIYSGNHFREFFKKYNERIIHCFNPFTHNEFINYLLSTDFTKNEINEYDNLKNINCVIMK